MKVAIGCDELGLELKKQITALLECKGHKVCDFGVREGEMVDYPETGYAAAHAVALGECERGILICGTGIGMAMTANKVKGIRAAVCHDVYSTQRSILSNNAQIMCMGALVIAPRRRRNWFRSGWICNSKNAIRRARSKRSWPSRQRRKQNTICSEC